MDSAFTFVSAFDEGDRKRVFLSPIVNKLIVYS